MRHRFAASYDYIVVGAGSAGSVLAERLGSDPTCQVLVLEAGGSDRHPRHLVPAENGRTSTGGRYTRTYSSAPQGEQGSEDWVVGRVLGGSSTVNGMLWRRGDAATYDAWESAGNPGWNGQRLHDAITVVEGGLAPGRRRRGAGPAVGAARPPDPVSDAVLAAMAAQSIAQVDDVNAHTGERAGYAPRNVDHGLRLSAARGFLGRAQRRGNVTVSPHSEVGQLVVEDGTVTGVQVECEGRVEVVRVRREVISCAGALGSPLLLERSGIGDSDVLEAAGIRPTVPSPRVGENLRQQRGTLVPLRLRGLPGYNPQLATRGGRLRAGAQYLVTRQGPMSHGASTVMALLQADLGSPGPDTQLQFLPWSVPYTGPSGGAHEVEPGATLGFYPIFPSSTGSVHVTGRGADDRPRLLPAYLSTEEDRRVVVAAFRRVDEILRTEPAASTFSPLTALPTEHDEIVRHVLERGFVVYHPVGTCAMGPDPADVVDASLRVRGVRGLRVADASVLPTMPSGSPNATAMAVGLIAGELIASPSTARQETPDG